MARLSWIKVRVSPEEKSRLQVRADVEGVTVADLLRSLIDARLTEQAPKRKRRHGREIDHGLADLIRQIARIGNNLNQIARWANTYKEQADAVEVLSALIVIERRLNEVH